jgi:hypothetical protein
MKKNSDRADPGSLRAIDTAPSTLLSPVTAGASCAIGGSCCCLLPESPPCTSPYLPSSPIFTAR